MAQEVETFDVTIPAGTAKAAGFSSAMTFPNRVVTELEVRIPPGPRGEVGWSIGASGQPVIPVQAGTYIVGNDEVIRWPLDGYIDSGAWTFYGYNTGRYPHTIEVRFLCDVPGEGSTPATSVSSLVGLTG